MTSPIDTQSSSSTSKGERWLGRRWWLIAAIAFAGINVVLSPLTMMLMWAMLIAVGVGGSPLPQQLLAGAVAIVVIPGLLSGGLATLVEFTLRRLGKPDRATRWGWRTPVIILALVSPFVFLPVMFALTLNHLTGNKEGLEAARQHAQRPIAESDSMGFCSVPTWTILDGRPAMTIAVRVPKKGSYGLMVQGAFGRRELPSEHGKAWTEQGLTGLTIRELGPGVDTMTVRFEEGGPIEWPVRINYIDLSWANGEGSLDARSGDSLYVIDETGLREKRH